MAPHLTAVEVYVGNRPRVIASGTVSTTVATESTVITLLGTIDERRAVVLALADELDLRLVTDVTPHLHIRRDGSILELVPPR